ncbi:lithostathine-1-beta-like [Corythoichthys intestinalis]|uniref:lithostathine-1-beta-like n=1 Tax=Corythoichthys intestinalis TaxID=161448 RepID=UPI0025A5DDEF|nr:lithostathine-1-beta-like [Corythoichthys intestinalis]
MAFALCSFFLLLGISGLLPGASSNPLNHWKKIRCPSGYTQLDCHCYQFRAGPSSFVDAELDCIGSGGNLASIPNKLANIVVQELLREGSASTGWFGLHDAILDDDFIWTDGSSTDFRNFADMEPNDTGNCVEMVVSSGEWEDEDCASSFPYVCVLDVCHGSKSDDSSPCPSSPTETAT